ncbi:unnamed protein product [Lactuca virosa]|uniref:RING-type E3 ubiquitin transferase n=1 Tax=Lactuca virosa TaxID=75947 RepID=A0AAU9M771_9ASTR|nr:unnamed protein product [Lactuca virosa]
MGCLLCCFRAPEVDQEDEDPDDGQQIQQPNATTNRSTEVQDTAFESDALLGKGSTDVTHSQVVREPVLESNKMNSEKSEDCVVKEDNECLICFEEYTLDNPKITTKCSHHYHLGCILNWQERSEFCPVCSRVMDFEEMN